MQSYLASGYVGQTVRLALGKSLAAGRVAYIDTPSTRSAEYTSLRTQHDIRPIVHSYWPGAAHARLHLEHFPRVGPLSHTHYLLKKHQESRHGTSSSHEKHIQVPEKLVTVESKEDQAKAEHAVHHHQIAAQYVTVPRGQLLPMDQYGQYHEARLKGATFVFQTPSHYSVNPMKRTALETMQPVIAAEVDMRVVSGGVKMIATEYEAGNMKPQRRALSQRVFRTSSNLIRNTCPPKTSSTSENSAQAPYIHPNDQLESVIEENFGCEKWSVDDLISLQRLMKQSAGDRGKLFPSLTLEDVDYYETTLDGVREAIEQRWAHFCPSPSSAPAGSAAVHEFRLWPAHSRDFLLQLSNYLQTARREDILALTEKMKPLLKFNRKANPNLKTKRSDQEEAPQAESIHKMHEDWPLVFDAKKVQESIGAVSPADQHLLVSSNVSEPERAIIFGLALLASSTLSHPIPLVINQILSNLVLQPLGYMPNPNGAQLLLTHLGLPISDPVDVPFVLNAPIEDANFTSPLLRAYPWSHPKEQLSLQEFIRRLHDKDTNEPLSLDAFSPRHNAISSLSNLSDAMALQASQVPQPFIDNHLQDVPDDLKRYLSELMTASKSPAFHISKSAISTSSGASPLHVPNLLNDSSTLLGHVDPDRETRRDLSAISSYAIDDKSTTEVDDAFGLDLDPLRPHADWILNHLSSYLHSHGENLTDSRVAPPPGLPRTAKVFIHIADPTTAMTVGDPLELGARERIETMYLPHRKSFMLPSILSEYYCSLQPGEHMNIGLTFEAQVNILTGALEAMDVYPSKFRGMKRFDYETTQSLLSPALPHGDLSPSVESMSPTDTLSLKILHKLAEARKKWRKHEGKAVSMHLPKRQVRVRFDGTTEPSLELYDDGNPQARSLVEEMMVLVGEISGRMGVEEEIAIPFRIQPFRSQVVLHTPDLSHLLPVHDPTQPTLQSIKECEVSRMMLVHNLQSLILMATSETTAQPAPHQSLGINAYARASSPLRRYADLITHFQLKAWKRYGGNKEKLPYSPALVQRLSQHIHTVSKDIKYTQQSSERWWKQQYVLRQAMDRTWEALVFSAPDYSLISIGLSRPLSRTVHYSFFIMELDLTVSLPAPAPLKVGSIVQLKPIALSEINLDWQVVAPVS